MTADQRPTDGLAERREEARVAAMPRVRAGQPVMLETALHRLKVKTQQRIAEGRPAPNVPLVNAALGYDVLGPGSLAAQPNAAEQMVRQQRRKSGAAITPGRRPKEASRDVYAQGNNYIDRQHPEYGRDE